MALFIFIDWIMELPEEFELQYKESLHQYEEEKKMRYITSIERLSRKAGRQEGRQEGREEGREEIMKEIVDHLLQKNRTIDEIVEITGFSKETVLALAGTHSHIH